MLFLFTFHLFHNSRDTMVPDPFHVVVDDIQYKIYVSYGKYENMVSGKFGAKERAF